MDRLKTALIKIEKDHGKRAIFRLGDPGALPDVEAIPTGSLGLDAALGIGGIPRGRITEIYGPESSAKTTMALHIISHAQKLGSAAFIDVEHALDAAYAKNLGVNTDDLLVCQPDCGEQALDIAEGLIASEEISIVVIDSVAALVPRAEIEGETGQQHMGLQARLMSQACRRLTPLISRTNTVVIFINQIRYKLNVKFGSPETTSGGNALKFYASIRIDMRAKETNLEDEVAVSKKFRAKVVKNKVAPPFREATFDVVFGQGVDRLSELIDLGPEFGVIDKNGAWYSYNSTRLGQGKENAWNYLLENPELTLEIENKIRAAILPEKHEA